MSTGTRPVPAKTAAEIARNVPLSEPAAELLREGMQPRPFLDLLLEQQHYADAVLFLAHTMPKREAIWWACLCSRPEKGAAVPPPAAAAQQAAEAWVISPSDEKRRAAHAAAQACIKTPVGLTCEAVFFSEGSLRPPEFKEVPPPGHLAASNAAKAVVLGAVGGPPKLEAKYRQFLGLGQDVAAGKNGWK